LTWFSNPENDKGTNLLHSLIGFILKEVY